MKTESEKVRKRESGKESPILFNGEMVRAILEDRKTQTRRLVMPQPVFTGASGDSFEWHGGPALQRAGYGAPYVHTDRNAMIHAMLTVSQWQPTERLWVRETWAPHPKHPRCRVAYRADMMTYGLDNGQASKSEDSLGAILPSPIWPEKPWGKNWRPSIHMPRWASRLTLEIIRVEVEPIQDITFDDALAEGIQVDDGQLRKTPNFRQLWDSIHLHYGYGWSQNPWVWVIHFKRV